MRVETSNFVQLEKELEAYKPLMGKAADSILDQEISDYPIFIIHQLEVAVGIPLVEKNNDDLRWSIAASSLEEFVSKQLIEQQKVDSFRTIYKDPNKFLCLFVLSELGAHFIFMPRRAQRKS